MPLEGLWDHGETHSQRTVRQPPGGAVGEGKWTVIKQAATETPSIRWVYEVVISSQPLTMKEETPSFHRRFMLFSVLKNVFYC